MTVREALVEALGRTGKNCNVMGREAGVPQPVLYRFLKGTRSINLGTVERLCEYLGLELRKAGG